MAGMSLVFRIYLVSILEGWLVLVLGGQRGWCVGQCPFALGFSQIFDGLPRVSFGAGSARWLP